MTATVTDIRPTAGAVLLDADELGRLLQPHLATWRICGHPETEVLDAVLASRDGQLIAYSEDEDQTRRTLTRAPATTAGGSAFSLRLNVPMLAGLVGLFSGDGGCGSDIPVVVTATPHYGLDVVDANGRHLATLHGFTPGPAADAVPDLDIAVTGPAEPGDDEDAALVAALTEQRESYGLIVEPTVHEGAVDGESALLFVREGAVVALL